MSVISELAASAKYWVLRGLVSKQAAQLYAVSQVMPGITQYPPVRGTREFLIAYSHMPWLRAVTAKIATGVASVPWHVGFVDSQGAQQELPQHPMSRMLMRGTGPLPGGLPGLSGRDVRKVTQLHLDIVGEAFWLLERNGVGAPVATIPLPPHWVQSLPVLGRESYRIQPDSGTQIDVPASEIIMFRDPNPEKPYERGSGIARALMDELNADEGAARYVSAYLANHARPDIIVTGTKEAPMTEDESKRMEAAWKPKFSGPRQAGKPMFSSGAVQVHEVGRSFRDIQMRELREFERDTIISVYGLPPEKLGVLQNANRSTIEAADDFFGEDILQPRLSTFEDVFTVQLAVQYDSRLEVWHDDVVKGDKEHTLNVMKAAPYHFSRSAWQEAAGRELEPDEENIYLVPMALMPVPVGTDIPAPASNGEAAVAGLLSVRKIGADDIVQISDMVDEPQVRAAVNLLWRELLADLVVRFGQETIEALGSDLAMELTGVLREWVNQTAGKLIAQVNETTRANIARTLRDGIVDGEKIEQLTARVRSVFQQASQVRAKRIAMTESTRAAGAGNLGGLNQAGMRQKQWLTTLDGSERETHAALDGQVQLTGNPFVSSSGATAQAPGDFGIAGEDVNCFVPETEVRGEFVGGLKALYAGDVVTIETRRGNRLTVTPNHPVLTPQGFRPAHAVNEGDDLIAYGDCVKLTTGRPADEHEQQMPASIEEVFGTLRKFSPHLRTRLGAEHLHGDAARVQGDVEVVVTDVALRRDFVAKLREHALYGVLMEAADLRAGRGTFGEAVERVLLSAPAGPSGAALALHSLAVLLERLPLQTLRVGSPTDLDASLTEAPRDRGAVNAGLVREFLHAHTGLVERDEVVDVRYGEFRGHVYDLQSVNSLIVANGLVVSNCRCTLVAYIGEEQDSAERRAALYQKADATRQAAESEIETAASRMFRMQAEVVLERLSQLTPI